MDQKLQGTQKAYSSGNQAFGNDSAAPRSRKQGRPSKAKEQNPQVFEGYKQTIDRFLKPFFESLDQIPDHRNQKLVYYSSEHYLFWVLTLFLTHQGSCHQQGLRKGSEQFMENFRLFSGCTEQELASDDAVVGFFKKQNPAAIEKLWIKTIRSLIRGKCFDFGRQGNRWAVAIDATGCDSSDRPFDEFCLTKVHADGTTTYHRSALVAFLILDGEFAIPMAVEFIENMDVNASKQDCEIKAFHRLARKIKDALPHTPLWILGDALYADQNVIRRCQKYGWGYSINLKQTDLPAFWREAQDLLNLSPLNKSVVKEIRVDQKSRTVTHQWVNQVDYYGLKLSVVFLEEQKWLSQEESEALEIEGKKPLVTTFSWITHQSIDRSNVESNARTGRQRWCCENEGFNVLKNGGFKLEHAYTRNRLGFQCFFILMLIAHTIQQLVAKGSLLKKVWGQIASYKNLAKLLSEAFMREVFAGPIPCVAQIRLRPDS